MRPTQISPSILSLLLLGGCAGGTPDGLPPPFSPDQVVDRFTLSGPEGVRAEVIQSEDAALVELTRVRDAVNGKVLLTSLEGSTTERYYVTEVNGRQVRLLRRKDRQWRLLYGGPMALEVDEAATGEIKANRLIDAHVQQRASGALAALARFDVKGAQDYSAKKLGEEMARMEDECGFVPAVEVDFDALTEAQLKKYSIYSYCGSPRGALERACKIPELKAFVTSAVQRYRCTFGEAPALAVEDGALVYTVNFDTPNQDRWARDAFDKVVFDETRTVRQSRMQNATTVCATDGGKAHVVVGPRGDEATQGVAYGKGGKLVRQPLRRGIGDGWFFEPRYQNPGHNSNFRGYDLRYYSYIDTEGEKVCKLRCGPREIALTPLEGADKRAFLESAEWKPLPDPREAYALARDKRGTYYFVDRGATPETAKDFRLYVGQQGRLRLQKMKDIVSDSEGEIFASARGRLKLLLGKENAEWQSRGRTRRLVRVAIRENIDLIYNRLGVYLGVPMHTPCDDL